MCGVKTKPVRVTSALEASELNSALGGSSQSGSGLQMNAIMDAAFESNDIQAMGAEGFPDIWLRQGRFCQRKCR